MIVSGNGLVGSITTKAVPSGITIRRSLTVNPNKVVGSGIIRAGGSGGMYKTVTETKVIHHNEATGKYYVTMSFESSGDPISVYIGFTDDDVQYTGKCSVSGKEISFSSEDDVTTLPCTVTYMYRVL